MKTIDQITVAIDSAIAARKEQLPAIQAERSRVAGLLGRISSLQAQLEGLSSAGADEAISAEVAGAKATLAGFVTELEGYRDSLDELKAEFTRDTLNIGVSGAARTGKSTTLQHITGLTDRQIPSGGLNPVTAVRSEIYNSPRNEVVITFKTERDFVEGYVRPHVANVNEFLGDDAKGHFTDFEGDLQKAADTLAKRGFRSVEFITTRNTTAVLEQYAAYLEDEGFIVTFGSEHNTPAMEPVRLRTRDASELSDKLKAINYRGACAVAAHQAGLDSIAAGDELIQKTLQS